MSRRKRTTSPASPHWTPKNIRDIRTRLLDWYDRTKRDLPWRRTSDPYAILVSEFMLQQTQVATVVPYYERFLEDFPTVHALAEAPEQEVLRLWAGLGYYSRARNLHASAKRIVEQYGGRVPEDFADLLFLPGVGRYVAGAVTSIAFGASVPALDTNVSRVICRLLALDAQPSAPRDRRMLEDLAARLVPRDRAGDHNQAMMELGARVCVSPAKPSCGACPLRAFCVAREQGNPEAYPPPPKRTPTVEVEEACAVVRRGGLYFVARRPSGSGRYRNMWEFPHVEISHGSGDRKVLAREPTRCALSSPHSSRDGSSDLRQDATSGKGGVKKKLADFLENTYGLTVRVEEEWAEIRHQVTHHKIRKRVFLCTAEGTAAPEEDEAARWASLDEIEALPLGAPHKRILKILRESVDLFQIP